MTSEENTDELFDIRRTCLEPLYIVRRGHEIVRENERKYTVSKAKVPYLLACYLLEASRATILGTALVGAHTLAEKIF